MDYPLLLQKTKQFINQYFASQVHHPLTYHNKAHTERVVDAVIQIANHYQVSEHDFFIVTVSAWFHDMGYYTGSAEEHEKNGAVMAAAFLAENGVDQNSIDQVKDCIMATRMPQKPANLLEQIVCDGDLFHLGTKDFSELNKLMRKEAEERAHKEIDKKEWRRGTIAFLQYHHYQTDYCQLLLNQKKQENLEVLLKKQKEPVIAGKAEITGASFIAPATQDKEIPKVKKPDRPVRGIETMFRVASTNHQRLSDMADSKAHIMISVNSIILSVVIGLMARKLESFQSLIIPTLILLTGSVIAVVFSVLATRPKIPNGYFTPEQLASKSVNLLFFGNFYKMDYEHYYAGMKELMSDSDFLYGSLIRDIHSQGIVLGHKYKLLRISYTIFMFTLIIAVFAFSITFIFFS
ncbi:MAG: Pycsar system effector family protein [Bacteroidota bacterium]